ncbi:SDR family oxidoreductase [Leptolyngbya sp. FACHB-541]|uniref:SDR family NAD(P)-dependent oxidoreductase n=1 Tax=Leptolyngbya sp. FACHB-541 TaxID=2692810 RepID=UPI001687AC9F|nr:SDR family oxidoreductase [Leptolyngbya sp. FACHB-541]MBD1997318.1 SDR family oxidoreductase [Leptolyngbya sp. FACHB-541]
MTNNKSKIALVTGSSRGLGKNTALALAKKGVDVIVTYRSSEAEAISVVSEVAEIGGKAVALQLDTSDTKTFDKFVAQIKQTLQDNWQTEQFDFLVNNAGIGINKPFTETTEDDFDRLMNIQFKGVFFLTQKLLPLLKDGGRIVNLSSGLARFTLPGYSAYASMKGAIEVLTRYMAKELGHRQIAVNVVAPGAIETDFAGGSVRDNPGINQFIASQTALGRVGVPDDIGGAIAALLSEDNRWVNAQRIEVSGGQSI